MKKIIFISLVLFLVSSIFSQQLQVPNIFLNNNSKVKGGGIIHIVKRKDAVNSGNFEIKIDCECLPPKYPAGKVKIMIELSESSIVSLSSTSILAVNSAGKHTPTVFIMGKCDVKSENKQKFEGCHFWIMIADNCNEKDDKKKTPDIVSFFVLDGKGNKLAYGTGPLIKGDIEVQ